MEVTAAERTTIYTNISPLAQRVNNYIQTQHSSIAAVAKGIGYPRCGEIVCGVWPHIVSEGHLVASTVMAQGGASGGGNPFPRAGTFAASEEFYHFGAYTIYQGFASDIEVGSKAAQGAKVYLRCSTSTRCSTNAKGGAAE